MQKLRVGVVGVGHLGSIHARIYKEIADCSLVGICDIDQARLKEISQGLGVEGYSDYRGLLGKVDAVSIATPTRLHFAIAAEFLSRGVHALVEKPFTTKLEDADSLIGLARKSDLILQVGHIERFNSAFNATKKLIKNPRFIECHRLSPFSGRSVDVGAVLDIMIHDIDIVMGLVPAQVKKIESVGVNVVTEFEDIANSRLTFANGCIANLTASRISDEAMRKIRIFQEDTYISLDYKAATASIYRKNGSSISKENLPIEKEEPLPKELQSFVDCAIEHKDPLVSGEVAREALAVALEIQEQIWQRNIS